MQGGHHKAVWNKVSYHYGVLRTSTIFVSSTEHRYLFSWLSATITTCLHGVQRRGRALALATPGLCASPCPILLDESALLVPLSDGFSLQAFALSEDFNPHVKLRQDATRGTKENLKHASRSSLASVRAHEWLFQRPLLHIPMALMLVCFLEEYSG